jgi:hypothetical protein
MKKILALAALAGVFSSCVGVVVVGPTSAQLNSASLSARFQSTANGNEYYICGNRDEVVSVSINYTGSFNSYRIVFIGQLNPGQNQLVKGPFPFDATNGDTSTSIIRRVTIAQTDVKPTESTVKPQAVIVTPTPVPPQTDAGLGGFQARVEMLDSNGTLTATSTGYIKVLGNGNANCQ